MNKYLHTAWNSIAAIRCLLIAATGIFLCTSAFPADLILYYYERPPFMHADAAGPSGYFIERTERVLGKAGISYEWKLRPVNRIFADLKANNLQVCSPGWFATPERRSIAAFSKAIYHNMPLVGLARSDSPIPENTAAATLFKQSGLTVLLKESAVYGVYLDDQIAKIPATNILRTTTEFSNAVKMIYAKRADFTIVAEEEVDTFIKNAALNRIDFKILHFTDEPAVEYRYILCSHTVPAELMNRIDKAIDQLGLP
jgi:polar amino acid transport system substrate-binding protein